VALKPIHDRWTIKRVVVSTYQAVTGAGKKGMNQLAEEVAQQPVSEMKFPHQIAFNVLPQIDVFLDDGSTKEERKMVDETKKIMGDESIAVTATCVRVPVYGGHSEAVNLECAREFSLEEVHAALRAAPGLVVVDDPPSSSYPMPVTVWEKDEVFVGRIRRDPSVQHGLNLWVVADNLRKGAATNAVQIAEEWIRGE
jgi:aspartate-semialdehyde dehydrogenase